MMALLVRLGFGPLVVVVLTLLSDLPLLIGILDFPAKGSCPRYSFVSFVYLFYLGCEHFCFIYSML